MFFDQNDSFRVQNYKKIFKYANIFDKKLALFKKKQ